MAWVSIAVALLLFFSGSLFGVDFGSDTAVSVQGPAAISGFGNALKEFGAFTSGFNFQDADTSCTFSSYFPLAGVVNLTGGDLFLQQDLIFGTTARIDTVGHVHGAGLMLEFSPSITQINFDAALAFTLENVTLALTADLLLDIQTEFLGTCTIDARGNRITLGNNGSLLVTAGNRLTIINAFVEGLLGTNVSCGDDAAGITLQNSSLILSHDVTFNRGSLGFVGDVVISGTNILSYTSVVGSTIHECSTLMLDSDVAFTYNPAGPKNDLLIMNDATSRLFFNGCNFHVSSTGLVLTKGTLVIDGKTKISSDAASLPEAFFWGSDASSNDLSLDIRPAAQIEFLSGFIAG